jgi:hypothetical protein
MTATDTSQARFDEGAALAELERLQRAIEESRRRRSERVDEFNAFVRSFKASPESQGSREPDPIASVNRTDQIDARPVAERPAESDPGRAAGVVPAPLPSPATAAGARLGNRRLLGATRLVGIVVAAAALVTTIGVVLLTRSAAPSRSPASGPSTRSGSKSPASVRSAPQTTTSAAASAAPGIAASSPGGVRVELTTLRDVWMRVAVDGQRVIEREFGANQRIPLSARESIAIRAGDGGAVRVALGGQDQGLLGRDGLVVNRTFTTR